MVDDRLVMVDPDGPATVLVPTESVLLTAVDLPLASAAKRIAALPFAVEDRIADPVEVVHLALGAELEPKRYLAGVVRHSIMSSWLARLELAGLSDAALVPDALALPRPDAGQWAVAIEGRRALVRVPDGTGFALPDALLPGAWERAGRPQVLVFGDPLPAPMEGVTSATHVADQLDRPALDLRQGVYTARPAGSPFWRRLGWIAGIAVAAHAVIVLADVMMLRAIAYRRAAETIALVQQMAPNAQISGDVAAGVADLLPVAQGDARFGALLSRLSAALMPMQGALSVRSVHYNNGELSMDIDTLDPAVAARVRSALSASGIAATVDRSPSGGLLVRARG